MKSCVILGTGRTLSLFNKNNHPDSEIWATGSVFPLLKGSADLYFCLHDGENINHHNVLDQDSFPLIEVVKYFQSDYFTNTISYMVAYAIMQGYEKISLYGVEMEHNSEYAHQRPCLTYWLGFATGKGIIIDIKEESTLLKSFFMYGFENMDKLKKVLKYRLDFAESQLGDNHDKNNQLLGQIFELKFILEAIK